MSKVLKLAVHSSPLALGMLLSYLFWRHNITLLIIYLILTALAVLSGKDKNAETWIFIYGFIAGFAVETIGTKVSGYQAFTNPDILGIPYWLPVTWGYGFVLMKRIGLIIATGSAWVLRQK